MVPVRYRSRACSDAWNAASRPARAERLRAMPATTVFHSRWIASPAASVARSWRADVTPRENGWLVLTSGRDGRGCVRDSPGGTWLRKRYRYADSAGTVLMDERDIRREGYKIEDRNGHEVGRAFVFFVGKESDIRSGKLPRR